MPYESTGDFEVLRQSTRLMLVRIQDDPATAYGALLDISCDLVDRAIAADAKSRKARSLDSDGQAGRNHNGDLQQTLVAINN